MKELKCSNCGASIKEEFSSGYVCPYCGSKFLINEPKDNSFLPNIIKYGYSLLSDFEFEKAYSVFENGLNYDFENSDIRFGLLLAKTNVSSKEKFVEMDRSIEKKTEYINALKYADENIKVTLSSCFRSNKKEKRPRHCKCIDCSYYISNVKNKKCEIYDIKPIKEDGYCADFKWRK